jgi:hypothetical protein
MPRTKTIEQLRRELGKKTKLVARLEARRAKIMARLDGVDRQIAQLTGSAPAGGKVRRAAVALTATGRRRRAPRSESLPAYIVQVLSKAAKPMRAKHVMEAVSKAGYKTKSKDFYGIVATALRDTARFKKVARGVYTMQG